MLLLDGLLNFSRSFLPENRGGTMDAPLVLTTRIDPKEIDKEALNVDVCDHYPLEVYLGALDYAQPKRCRPPDRPGREPARDPGAGRGVPVHARHLGYLHGAARIDVHRARRP